MKNNKERKIVDHIFSDKIALITTAFSIAILVVAVLAFIILGSWHFSWILDEEKVAHFGDFVGGVVGTLLAFAAAILYYVALNEQRKDVKNNQKSLNIQNKALQQQIEEFRQQKSELEETRRVYEKQTQLMSEQSHIMKQQQFESSFYSMLSVYMDCKNQMEIKEKNCFRSWIEMFENKIPEDYKNVDIFDRHKIIMSIYEDFYCDKRDVLSPYFKTVYSILCLIDNCDFIDKNLKIQYVKIFRAQLGDYETLLLYYDYHSRLSEAERNIAYKLNFLKHYDYLLSIDAKIVYGNTLIQDKEMQLFLHKFDGFIKESINNYCDDFSEETSSLQMEFEYKGIISDISSTPDLSIIISIPTKSEKLTEEFCSFISDYISDRVFLSQFSSKNEHIQMKELGEVDGRRVYGCVLHSSFVQKQKIDDYE